MLLVFIFSAIFLSNGHPVQNGTRHASSILYICLWGLDNWNGKSSRDLENVLLINQDQCSMCS